jgi:dolichol-phosphate mannosyltransferase
MLWLMLSVFLGERSSMAIGRAMTTFNIANTIAALVAMTFNFVLNNG